MTFARTFSVTSLLMLGLLIYGGIASAQTTSYIPGIMSSTNAQNTTGTSGVNNASSGSSTHASGTSSGSVLGASTTNPNLPNTGAGGNATGTVMALLASGLAALGGLSLLVRRNAF